MMVDYGLLMVSGMRRLAARSAAVTLSPSADLVYWQTPCRYSFTARRLVKFTRLNSGLMLNSAKYSSTARRAP